MDHARNFIQKFILLATDDLFQPFWWKRPGSHWPMQPCMIILIDLYDRPTNEDAATSRALIDGLFKLSGFVNSLDMADCHDQWVMLLRLRSIVWHRAGLDPSILWTEEQHRQATASPSSGEIVVSHVAGQNLRQNHSSLMHRNSRSESPTRKSPESPRLPESLLLDPGQQPFASVRHQPASLEEAIAPRPSPAVDTNTSEARLLESAGSCNSHFLGAANDMTLPGVTTSSSTYLKEDCRQAGNDAAITNNADFSFDWDAWDAVFGQAVVDVDIDSLDWIGALSSTSQDSRSP